MCCCMLQVGGEFAVSTAEQRRQIQALRTLSSCLSALAADDPMLFEGDSLSGPLSLLVSFRCIMSFAG